MIITLENELRDIHVVFSPIHSINQIVVSLPGKAMLEKKRGRESNC